MDRMIYEHFGRFEYAGSDLSSDSSEELQENYFKLDRLHGVKSKKPEDPRE